MIAGHSNGQPSTKMSAITSSSLPRSGSGTCIRALLMRSVAPSLVNTAPNTLDATARNSTMLDVTSVERAVFFSADQVSLR